MKPTTICLAFLLVVTAPAAGALEILEDTGETEPIAPYLRALERDDSDADEPAEVEREAPAIQGRAVDLLPVDTPELEPGDLDVRPSPVVRERLRNLPRPLCIVGADQRSVAWLGRHRDALVKASAVCMLVDAETRDDLERVQVAAGPVPVQLTPGSELAESLGLAHYPAVLSAEGGFEQ